MHRGYIQSLTYSMHRCCARCQTHTGPRQSCCPGSWLRCGMRRSRPERGNGRAAWSCWGPLGSPWMRKRGRSWPGWPLHAAWSRQYAASAPLVGIVPDACIPMQSRIWVRNACKRTAINIFTSYSVHVSAVWKSTGGCGVGASCFCKVPASTRVITANEVLQTEY